MRKKKNYTLFILILLVMFIGIGFALLSSNITINGSSKITNPEWDVHFANLQVVPESVAITNGYNAATINTTTGTDISFSVPLHVPGDFYEFTVDIVNDGKIDAVIPSIEKKVNNQSITNLPSYAIFEVYDSNRVPLESNIHLEAGNTIPIIVRVEYSSDIDLSDLPSNEYDRNTFDVLFSAIQMDPTLYYYLNSTTYNIVSIGDSPSDIDNVIEGNPLNSSANVFLRHFISNGAIEEVKLGIIYDGEIIYLSGKAEDYNDNINIIESYGYSCSDYSSYYNCDFSDYNIKLLKPDSYYSGLQGASITYDGMTCYIGYDEYQSAQCDG